MAKVSVIVPVYNSEKYLEKCLNSLVQQTLEEIEIIIVNDGSTDSSANIIKKYLKMYPKKITSITKKNGGLSSARNAGLEIVKSPYVGFVDSDDYVAPTMFEEMYEKIIEGYDIVACSTNLVYNDKVLQTIPSHFSLRNDYKDYLLSPPMAWNKLFKTSLFSSAFRFKDKTFYEDLELIPTLILQTDKIAFLNENYYQYVQNHGSIMHQTQFNVKIYDIFPVLESILTRFETFKATKEYEKELEYLAIEHLLYSSALRLSIHKKERKASFLKIHDWIEKHYPDWKNNPYYQKKSWKFRLLCSCTYNHHPVFVYLLARLKRGVL